MTSTSVFKPLWFVSLSLLLVILVLPFLRQGMFLDGIIYAAIAKNLALGYGSVWHPYYSATDFTSFYEHPPLVFYFQSLFFKVLGQGFGVERLYSFLMALGQLSLISWYWLNRQRAAFTTLSLLLLVWLLVPLNHLYASNMLEDTLTLFTTMASLILLVRTRSSAPFLMQYFACAMFMVIAFFCNGPSAFFPLALPVLRAMVDEEHTFYRGIKESLLLSVMVVTTLTGVYLAAPQALANTRNYFEQQLLASVIGTRQPVYAGLRHLNILLLYVRACWPASLFACICVAGSAAIRGTSFFDELKMRMKDKNYLLFLLLSLISSLPVGVSHRQAFNYIMPCAPFITLATMWFCCEPVQVIAGYFSGKPQFFRRFSRFGCILLASSLSTVILLASGYNRSKNMLADIYYLTHNLKNDAILSTSRGVYYDWYTGAYLSRHSMISITPVEGRPYYLALKHESIPDDYNVIDDAALSFYKLARRPEER